MIEKKPKIAVIGLGSMGMGMAQTLVNSGFITYGCDLKSETLKEFESHGGYTVKHPSDLDIEPDIIFIVVVNALQTRKVIFGDQGLFNKLKPGSLVIGCATCAPNDAIDISNELFANNIDYLDAPISGGALKAAQGQLTIMASGPERAFKKAETALDFLSENLFQLGNKPGLGSQVKLVNQLLAGVHIAAAAEAMAYGIKGGCDPNVLYDVITQSAGNSWMFENRVPHILKGDYTPLSAVDIFVKDLGLVQEVGRINGSPLPMASQAQTLFTQASGMGFGKEDDSGVIRVFPGIDLPYQAANDGAK